MLILVTGGAGYIGSHTVVELLAQGHDVIVVDNLSNSSRGVLRRISKISSRDVVFYKEDVCDKRALTAIFSKHQIEAVIHFAGLKSVGESVIRPLLYYRNNVDSTLALCEAMLAAGVKRLIFSSSATVYGNNKQLPYRENSLAGVGITNPYGRTKYMNEQILQDAVNSDPSWQVTILRYFNPIGAHPSGLIGEDPLDTPNNIMPYITQVAVGRLPRLSIFGDDYDTSDGTGVRDYIHVVDLAKGHVAALNHLELKGAAKIYNLGTGHGTSVLELVRALENASDKKVPYQIVGRRPGDLASSYADAGLAKRELGWQTEKSIEDACADSWRWQSTNPYGYRTTIG